MIKKSRHDVNLGFDFHKLLMTNVLKPIDHSTSTVQQQPPRRQPISPSPSQISLQSTPLDFDKIKEYDIGYDRDILRRNYAYNLENEMKLQISIVNHVREKYPYFVITDLGQDKGMKYKPSREERKEMGYTAGCCDLMLFGEHPRYTGMLFEFKTPLGMNGLDKHQVVHHHNCSRCI